MMQLLTVNMVIAAGPCEGYPRARVVELLGDGVEPLELLRLRIPAADRYWALVETGLLSASELRLLAARVARSALMQERRAGREPDPASWHAVRIAERHARGDATDEELEAASAEAASARASAAAPAEAEAAEASEAAAAATEAEAASEAAAAAAWAATEAATAREKSYRRYLGMARRILEKR